MLPLSLPIFQVVCEISLAFDFYLCHPTFYGISKTEKILSALSACAQAVLLVGNIPTSYLAKSSLSSRHSSSCAFSVKLPMTATGPGTAPLSRVLPTSKIPPLQAWVVSHGHVIICLGWGSSPQQNYRLQIKS